MYSPVERSRRKRHGWRMTHSCRSLSWYCDTAPSLTNPPHESCALPSQPPPPQTILSIAPFKNNDKCNTTRSFVTYRPRVRCFNKHATLSNITPHICVFCFATSKYYVDTTLMTVCHSLLISSLSQRKHRGSLTMKRIKSEGRKINKISILSSNIKRRRKHLPRSLIGLLCLPPWLRN